MSKQPFFSVVISLYNKEDFIENTVKSVINQTFINFEIIIVNDGSVDDSEVIVNAIKDSRIKLFTIKNQGASYARNYGIKKANAEYIALLDGDDLWCYNHLESMFHLINDFPSAGMYSSGYNVRLGRQYYKKNKLKGIPTKYRGIIKNYFESNLFDSIVNSSIVVIPRHIFNSIGMFNVNMKSGQDTYLWTQIAIKHKLAINNICTAIIIKNDNSLSNGEFFEDRLLFLDKFIKLEKENPSLKKFMDMNRYSVSLGFKINRNYSVSMSVFKNIDKKNLNFKQKLAFYLPSKLLKLLYNLKKSLDKKGIFFYLYR